MIRSLSGIILLAAAILLVLGGLTQKTLSETQNCWAQISSALKVINERVREIQKAEPKNGSGPQVEVGTCASRLRKLAGNLLCCKIFQNTAPYWEEISCLELKKYYLEKSCSCATKNSSYSNDEALQDQALEMYAAAKKIRDKATNKGIANPIIREYVKKINEQIDCLNVNSIEIIRQSMKDMEKIIAGTN